jgi:type IV pilus assembly protein PilM
VIGLDIGASGVRAAELEFGSGGPQGRTPPTLLHIGEVPLPLGAVRDGEVAQQEIVVGALRTLWQQGRFSSKDVVMGVGNQRVLVRELDLPKMPRAHLRESLPFQVNELLPMAVDDALLDYHPTGEVAGSEGRTVHGLLVAAQRGAVTANVLAVEGAGLRPTMVDLNAFALVRALAQGDLAQQRVALVDIGAAITTVVVAVQGQPKIVRLLPTGGQAVTNAVASALGIAPAEAENVKREIGIGYAVPPEWSAASEAVGEVVRSLVEAIRNTFVYFASSNPGSPLDVAVLTGGGAHLPGLGQYLSSASRLPVVLGDPLAAVRPGKAGAAASVKGRESLLAVPVGLAYGVAA